jgi:hypothetical protein
MVCIPTTVSTRNCWPRGTAIELLLHLLAQRRPHKEADQEIERDRGEDDQRQLPGIGKQHGDEDEAEDEIQSRE